MLRGVRIGALSAQRWPPRCAREKRALPGAFKLWEPRATSFVSLGFGELVPRPRQDLGRPCA
eukprot:4089301-Pyramimonas_sp.AAC.1